MRALPASARGQDVEELGVTADLEQAGGASVLHIVPTPLGRGAQIGARILADRLDERGAERHRLLSLFDGKPEVEIDLPLGYPAGGRPAEGFDPMVALQFRRDLAQLKPAAVVAHGGDAMKYALPALIGTGVPLVYCVIGTFAASPALLREWRWRRIMARATLLVAVGDEVRDECIGRFRVAPEHVVKILYGRDPFEFRPREGSSPTKEPTLIFVGALTAQKQPDRFVEVVRHLRSEGREFRALIVGDGPLAPMLSTVAADQGIELLGPRPDVAELLRQSDVFVFPSRPGGEGLPGVLVEAGLSGLPIVSTPAPGAAAVIRNGQTGLIVEDSVPALATAVGALLDDKERRAAMGAAARRWCESNFTLDQMVQQWWDTLQPLLVASEASRAGARAAEKKRAYHAIPAPRRQGVAQGGDLALGMKLGGGRTPAIRADLHQESGALVLHIVPTPLGRGAEIAARTLADRLDEAGVVRHRLLSLFDGKPEVEIDLPLGYPAGGRPAEGFDPMVALRFRRDLAQLKPAAVVAHGGDAMKYALPALMGTGVPVVYCVIGTFMGKPSLLREWRWRRIMTRATLLVAVGDEVRDECIERFQVAPEQVVRILNGRDPFEFRPRVGSAPTKEPTLIFVGALTAQKQPDRFVEVVRHLRSEGREFRALIVGDGPLAPTLSTVTADQGIELLGPRSDVAELLRQSDVFLFPSRPPEGLPGVLVEAGLSGLPTVSTPVPGATTVIRDGQTGLIVEDSVPALATAVGALMDDKERRAAMGAAARRWCESNFTLDQMVQQWRDALQPLLVAPEASRTGG